MRTPTGTGWRRPLVVVALVVAALLAGCSGGADKPARLPPQTASPSKASPSPTATPVEQQVEAAVRAYYAELVRAARTSDTTALRPMLVKTCPCYRAVRVIDRNKRQGERAPDIAIALTSVKVHSVVARTAAAEIRTRDAAYRIVNKSGKTVDRIEASSTHLDLALIRLESGAWVVANFFNLES